MNVDKKVVIFLRIIRSRNSFIDYKILFKRE